MKFNTTKEVLLKGIQSIQPGISTKSTLPILLNILLEATDNNIVMTTTDLEIGIVSTLPIKPNLTGAVSIPAKKFSDIIKELPTNTEITISVKKNNLVNIECEKNMFKIMGLPKEEFPQLPTFKESGCIVMEQKRLKKMVAMTAFATSHDEARYVLNGILFTVKPTYMRLVATDGRRLAMIEEKTQLPKTLEQKFIVPNKTVNELGRILSEEGDVKMLLGENQILFDAGPTKIASRLIEGEFPNYDQVIPKEVKDKVVVSREGFLAAIRRVALFTNPDSMAVKIDVDRDKITLSKSAPYLGEARVEIEAEYKGKELSAGFNPDYLADFLKSIDREKIGFELVDSEKPGVVRIGEEYIYVVLPMQLA